MLIQHTANYQFFRPIADEAVTFAGAASRLTQEKVSRCQVVVIRFTSGDGKLRISDQDATVSDGFDAFAGDTLFFSKNEAAQLSGIRGGVTNLVGWATYYA